MHSDIVVLGVNGMLGSTLFKYFKEKTNYKVIGILRNKSNLPNYYKYYESIDLYEYNITEEKQLNDAIKRFNPDFIINCIGIVKQNIDSTNPFISIKINSLFPHLLNNICKLMNCKLIHISTDCVFSGKTGFYSEKDNPDPIDLYGRSKLLGETLNDDALILRTSYIGEELTTNRGLLSWFLSQNDVVTGFSNAIYSGLPTIEIARVINEYVLPNQELSGLFHLSSEPIDKFNLLKFINKIYQKEIYIKKDISYKINRSLDSTKFRKETGYQPIEWEKAIEIMYESGRYNS